MSLLISLIVLACLFGASMIGLQLGNYLPRQHLSGESRQVIDSFMGLIALLSAVVLGLLVYAAKTSFDTKDTEWRHASANIVLLDRVMEHYGPETKNARAALRIAVERKLANLEGKNGDENGTKRLPIAVGIEKVQDELRTLVPTTESQTWLKKRALDVSGEIAQARWFLLSEFESSMPIPFLMILVFWLAIIFFSYGLFAPDNLTVIVILFLCAVSLAGSIYLIIEMDNSLEGPISISTEPLRRALEEISH